ncbi:sensor histidine kinase [Streptomyces qinglanensis]|uniref:histidine kinase n=1 Tax=Streptomyces qinglanensis TaxID=943816 RepID=A0A1H9WQD6_9ACTN|nr:HAMP domain-containing sensor histidine kinase [Streptomyces qinglanensis]SES35999.1 Signal transduction histidine kinase [Streptomyces qinglanensis]
MRTRLLPLLIVLLAGVLLALGFPLALSQAQAEQQRVVVDRIDDTARFASLAQFVTATSAPDERRATLQHELDRYHDLYGIRAGVFYRDGRTMAASPAGWRIPGEDKAAGPEGRPDGARAFAEALAGRRSHDPPQVWPWQSDGRIAVASPVIRDGDVAAVVLTDSPTGPMRSRTLRGWLAIAVGEAAAMLLALGAALRLTGWVLKPVRTLDRAAHEIATGKLTSRVVASVGPPELRRLAHSFNEMAGNLESVLEQQRAFVADASHQLRNPLSALLLRIELLALELPEGNEEMASVRAEGKRLARVLDDLLDLALAEHAGSAHVQLTDVAEVAAERVAAWRPTAEHSGVELRLEGQTAATGWADPVALSSGLDAVVDNAVKFTPEGGTVTVTVRAEGDSVTVETADGGPGLTDEELERVGDRFWRSGRHQNVSGSGLGLSITRALLAGGGAGLSFAHHEPRGLRVLITVPRNAPDAA